MQTSFALRRNMIMIKNSQLPAKRNQKDEPLGFQLLEKGKAEAAKAKLQEGCKRTSMDQTVAPSMRNGSAMMKSTMNIGSSRLPANEIPTFYAKASQRDLNIKSTRNIIQSRNSMNNSPDTYAREFVFKEDITPPAEIENVNDELKNALINLDLRRKRSNQDYGGPRRASMLAGSRSALNASKNSRDKRRNLSKSLQGTQFRLMSKQNAAQTPANEVISKQSDYLMGIGKRGSEIALRKLSDDGMSRMSVAPMSTAGMRRPTLVEKY